jgi:hypothetical protein
MASINCLDIILSISLPVAILLEFPAGKDWPLGPLIEILDSRRRMAPRGKPLFARNKSPRIVVPAWNAYIQPLVVLASQSDEVL